MGMKEQTAYTKEASQVNTGNTQKQNGLSLNELTPGKVFAGEVVKVENNKVLLKLESGQMIPAALNGDIKLQEGQMIAFQVKSNTGKQLAIKPMLDVALGNSSVLKALENAGLPVNKKNAELVNLLMKEQQPIDKKTIMQFLRQMLLNPEADVKTLVKLQKMGLPVTEENIARFEGYKNHEYRLAGEIKTVASQVAQLLGESVGQALDITGRPAEQQVLDATGKPAEQQTLETAGKMAEEFTGTRSGENIRGTDSSIETFEKIIDLLFPEDERIMDFQKSTSAYGSYGTEGAGEKAEGWKSGPVLYENLKSEAVLKNNGENLTDNIRKILQGEDP